MASSKAISVELSPRQQAILERQIESGRYQTASEVVGDALRLMADRDVVFDAWLREEVRASMADKQPPIPIDTVFQRLEARQAERCLCFGTQFWNHRCTPLMSTAPASRDVEYRGAAQLQIAQADLLAEKGLSLL